MATVLGIENLKQAALVGCQLGNAIDKSLEGGFQISDLTNFLQPLLLLPDVVKNKELILSEFKDLDAYERALVIEYVEDKLELRSEKTESIVIKGLTTVAAIADLVGEFKKEDTPELPEG